MHTFEYDIRIPDIALRIHRPARFVGFLIFAVYLTSFFLPADRDTGGWALFCMGFIFTAIVAGVPWVFPWLANPLLWVGLRAFHRGNFRVALCCGLAATLLAGIYPYFPGRLQDCGIGYWVWLASMMLLTVFAWGFLIVEHVRSQMVMFRQRSNRRIVWDVEPMTHATIAGSDRFTAWNSNRVGMC